jgi:hypothetical protein
MTSQYELIKESKFPDSFFPSHIDKSNLRDITSVGDTWRKYIDVSNGKIHDCEQYYNKYLNDRP